MAALKYFVQIISHASQTCHSKIALNNGATATYLHYGCVKTQQMTMDTQLDGKCSDLGSFMKSPDCVKIQNN